MVLSDLTFWWISTLGVVMTAVLSIPPVLFLLAMITAHNCQFKGHWWGKYVLGLHMLMRPGYLAFRNCSPWLAKIYAFVYQLLTLPLGIELPLGAEVGSGTTISHTVGIVIHTGARIGRNCVLHSGVVLGGKGRQDPPVIGDNVYIGANSVIAGPIRIGDNATIGACALVTEAVPEGALVGVPPASIIKNAYERPYANEPVCHDPG